MDLARREMLGGIASVAAVIVLPVLISALAARGARLDRGCACTRIGGSQYGDCASSSTKIIAISLGSLETSQRIKTPSHSLAQSIVIPARNQPVGCTAR